MRYSSLFCRGIFTVTVFVSLASISFAEITVSGDVNPDDPMTWGSWGTVYVGYHDHGMVSINNGDEVTLNTTWVAYGANSSGEINFDNGTLKVDSTNHRIKVGQSADTSLAQTLDIAGNLEFDSVTPPVISGMSAALAGGGAGNVNDGEHYYNVCFENADGR